MPTSLSLAQARQIALTSLGLASPLPRSPRKQHLIAAVRRLSLLQLDFVNVLAPAHHFVLFSRVGNYPRRWFDDVIYGSGEFVEHWAHEACVVGIEHWPLLRHRRESHRVRPCGFETFIEENPGYLSWVIEQVRQSGPLAAEDLPGQPGVDSRLPGSWFGSIQRATLEAHFGTGQLAVRQRRANFARVYDLAERVVPEDLRRQVIADEAAHRELLRIAARSYGVATLTDLADYYRMPVPRARPRVAELVEAGELEAVQVEGWQELAYLHPSARTGKTERAALLSPFDPLVWFRPRAKRLFDFDYRIEIYLPKERRQWGYYVLPFLKGDQLVGRIDLKADRPAGLLQVPAAYVEGHAEAVEVAESMAAELIRVAEWLELKGIRVEARTKFARSLTAAVQQRG